MILADVSAAGALFSTLWCLLCAATVIAFLIGLALVLRKSTRKIGWRVLFIATASIAIDLGLLIVGLTLDS